MMIKGYNEVYLDDVMEEIAVMFDYAVNNQHMDIDTFGDLFLDSPVCHGIEIGNPYYINKGGSELVMLVLESHHLEVDYITYDTGFGKTPEYWMGWITAYAQWKSGYKFSTIFSAIAPSDILALYYPLHEADVKKGHDVLMERIKKAPTNLYKLRKKSEITQKQLAQYAEVKERTIRAYEQRETEINKAQVNIVRALSLVLGCSIEDLLE